MPQIAQQDYIRIEIEDASALTDAEKAKLAAKVAEGTIFDCIIVYEDSESRVVGSDAINKIVYFYDCANEVVGLLDYSE